MDYERDESIENSTTIEVIRLTLKIYGTFFGVAFCTYAIVRPWFPLAYNFCNSVKEYNTKLAKEHYGHLKWAWKNFQHSDDEIFDSCGLTALVLIRFLRMGIKVAAVGIFNSLYLIPVNVLSCNDELDKCSTIIDRIEKSGLGNVKQGSLNSLATAVAAYIIFGSAMYFIYNEFEWFTTARHKFLMLPRPDNYSVYVSAIPKKFRGDVALLEYFRSIFDADEVIEASIALDLYCLEKKVERRDRVVQKLENAILNREKKSFEPTHLSKSGEIVQSIPTFSAQLEDLNTQISNVITEIEAAKDAERRKFLLKMGESGITFSSEASSNIQNSSKSLLPSVVEKEEMSNLLDRQNEAEQKPVEEVVTPTHENSVHYRDISELPVNLGDTIDEEVSTAKSSKENIPLPGMDNSLGKTDQFDHNSSESQRFALNHNFESDIIYRNDENEKLLVDSYHTSKSVELDENIESKPMRSNTDVQNHEKIVNHRRIEVEECPTTSSQNAVQNSCDTSNGGLLEQEQTSGGKRSHERNATLSSFKTSMSTISNKTKGSIQGTILKTTDGMKKSANVIKKGVHKSAVVVQSGVKNSATLVHGGVKKTVVVAKHGIKKTVDSVQDGAKKSVNSIRNTGAKSFKLATTLVRGSEDGKVRDGGFVTFSSLLAKAQCVQMIHHDTPFTFDVIDAPLPKDVYWNNVGLSHKKQQIGFVVAQLLTIGLCLFWTIPIAFVSSLSEVDSLKKTIPSLENAINKFPWIQTALSQLNPLLVVALKAMLPVILSKFCQREGHISKPALNASLLTKLAMFMIVQIFFVPAISGSIFAELPAMIEDWTKIVELLATSVPSQVKSFIQYVIVNVFLNCSLELLRVIRVATAFIRSNIGPNLSKKQRQSPFMGLEPLTTPEEMDFPMAFAEIVLYCMILLVYSCIAPIMSYVMIIVFFILLVTYTNQFIFVYSAKFDQGGVLWAKMMKITLFSMLLAQVSLIGIMSLQSAISSTCLIPLAWITFFFALYLEQQHYKVTKYLPSTICRRMDAKNRDKLDISFLNGQYVQPALCTKTVEPCPFDENENDNNLDDQV